MTNDPIRPLTARQREVAILAGRGLSCPQMARELTRSGTPIRVGRVRNIIREIALLLPNPDAMGSLRLVQLWAAHERWLAQHVKSSAA